MHLEDNYCKYNPDGLYSALALPNETFAKQNYINGTIINGQILLSCSDRNEDEIVDFLCRNISKSRFSYEGFVLMIACLTSLFVGVNHL